MNVLIGEFFVHTHIIYGESICLEWQLDRFPARRVYSWPCTWAYRFQKQVQVGGMRLRPHTSTTYRESRVEWHNPEMNDLAFEWCPTCIRGTRENAGFCRQDRQILCRPAVDVKQMRASCRASTTSIYLYRSYAVDWYENRSNGDRWPGFPRRAAVGRPRSKPDERDF